MLTPPARPWDVGRRLQNRGHGRHTWATPLSDTSTLTGHSHFWCLPFIKHNQNVQNDTGFARNQRKWRLTPAHAPACRAQPAEGAGRQDFGHWVVQAHLVRVAPKALEETMTGCQVSDGLGSALYRPRHCCSLLNALPNTAAHLHPPTKALLTQAGTPSLVASCSTGRKSGTVCFPTSSLEGPHPLQEGPSQAVEWCPPQVITLQRP